MEAPGFDLQVDSFDQEQIHPWLVRCRDPSTLNFIHKEDPPRSSLKFYSN